MNTITKTNTFNIIEKARRQKKNPFTAILKEGYAVKTADQALRFYTERNSTVQS